jgi:hypothetical protein
MNQKLLQPKFFLLLLSMMLASVGWAQINVTLNSANPTCSGFTDGSITAIASGGNGNYSYLFSTGDTGQGIAGLGAGTFSVTVTDTDGNTGTSSTTLVAPPELGGVITQGPQVCPAIDAASVVGTGGTPPYSFVWSNGQTGSSATNLGFGLACVDITDANGCEKRVCQSLSSPLTVDAQAEDVLCPGGCDGVAVAIVSGGVRPLTYLWNNGVTTAVNDMLLPGTYTVTVTDANGCTATDSGTVGEPDPFMFDFDVMNPDCGQMNGSVTAIPSGGTPPYSLVYDNGVTGPTLTGVGEGTFTVNLVDANGCTASGMVTLVGSNLAVSLTPVSPPCGPNPVGTATANVTGGTPPFTYLHSSGQTTQTATNLPPGMYTVTVTDANGCTGMASTTITAGAVIVATASATDVLCAGDENGTATVVPSGGQVPYTYLWNNGATTQTITDLAQGDYTVMVTDANGCVGTASTTVGSPTALICSISVLNPISAFGANDGQISTQFNGGTPPFTISYNTGQTGQVLSDLGPGTYVATVTDANGCSTMCDITLVEPAAPALGKIGDFVFRDLNNNGQQDPGDPGIEGAIVTLTLPDGSTMTQVTDAQGNYCFTDLESGDYKVTFQVRLGANDRFTAANRGNDATDSDAVPMVGQANRAMTNTFNLPPGDTNLTIDAGIVDSCIPVTDPGEIEASTPSVCGIGADPGPINSLSPAVSTGAIRYLWMRGTDPNFSTFTTAPGVNNQVSYDPGPITETTFFARCAFGVDCNIPVETNIVQITVGNTSRAIINGPTLLCVDEVYTFEAEDAGSGAVYMWDFGARATPQTATGRVVDVSYGLFGQRNVTLTVTRQGCETFATQRVAISNCFVPTPFTVNSRTIPGNSVALTWEMELDNRTGDYMIQRSLDGGVTFSDIGSVPVNLGSQMQSYEFVDNTPKIGYNVYRVVRVLDLGDTFFSETANASFVSQEVDFVAYPNPAVEMITVERFDNVEKARTVEVVDQSGRILRTVQFPAGLKQLQISLDSAPFGIVHLRVVSPNGVISSFSVLKQ